MYKTYIKLASRKTDGSKEGTKAQLSLLILCTNNHDKL